MFDQGASTAIAIMIYEAMRRFAFGSLALLLVACSSAPEDSTGDRFDTITCATGTHLEGSMCVADTPGLVCGADTAEQSGTCVATLRCGQGTTQLDDRCVPVDEITCGDGTVLADGVCVVDQDVTCGEGTVLTDGVCVAEETEEIECGPGTRLLANECVPTDTNSGPWYAIRIASTSIPADGISSIPVLAIGGIGSTPSTEQVLLSISRPVSGTLDSTALTLSPFGAETTFRPCSSAEDPRCVGLTYISMALASDPAVEVARTQEFELIAPMGVGSVAACELQTNALYFDGNGYVFNGTQLITANDAQFGASSIGNGGVGINVDPDDRALGLWWNANFEPPDGFELREQVYSNATRYPFNTGDEAGMSVTGDGRGCNRIEGSFEVHALRTDPANGNFLEVLISFEQFCEGSASSALRGCVKFTR